MARYAILVGDKELDLDPDTAVYSSFAIHDLQQIHSREGSFSESFELPITHRNSLILGSPENINTASRKAYQKLPCRILEDHCVIVHGTLQITGVKETYQVEISGGNTDFFAEMGDKSIKDVDLSEMDHLWSFENVVASAENTWEEGYCYPLINYGKADHGVGIPFDSLYPAVYKKRLVLDIIRSNGYAAAGEFLTNGLFERELLPVNKPIVYDEEFVKDRSCKVSKAAYREVRAKGNNGDPGRIAQLLLFDDETSTKEVYDGKMDNYDRLTGVYKADAPMYATVSFAIPMKVESIIGKSKVKFTLLKNEKQVDVVERVYKTGLFPGTKKIVFSHSFNTLLLQPNDKLKVYMEIRDDSTLFSYDIHVYFDTEETARQNKRQRAYLKVDVERTFPPGGMLSLTPLLPDIKQKDVFLSLANRYNLLFTTDPVNRILYMERFVKVTDNIEVQKLNGQPVPGTGPVDWTDKVDYSEPAELEFFPDGYGRESIFAYASDDNDPLLEESKDSDDTSLAMSRYGSAVMEIENEHLPQREIVFESVFAPTRKKESLGGTLLPSLPIYQIKEGNRFSLWSPQGVYDNKPLRDYVQFKDEFFRVVEELANNATEVDSDKPPLYEEGGEWKLNFGEWERVSLKVILDLFEQKDLAPRVLYRDDTITASVLILVPGTIDEYVEYSCHASFDLLEFENLLAMNYQGLSLALNEGKYLKLLVKLNAVDILSLDHTRPIWIASRHPRMNDRLNAYFYLSAVIQYKHGYAESCYVELLKILPEFATGFDAFVIPDPATDPDNEAPEDILVLAQANYFAILQANGQYILIS